MSDKHEAQVGLLDRLKRINDQLEDRVVEALEQWADDMEETWGAEEANPRHVAAALVLATAVAILSVVAGPPGAGIVMLGLLAPVLFLYGLMWVLRWFDDN